MATLTVPGPSRMDPGRATGGVARAMPGRCTCSHLATVHGGEGKRKPCSAHDPNPCPCTDLTPEGSDG